MQHIVDVSRSCPTLSNHHSATAIRADRAKIRVFSRGGGASCTFEQVDIVVSSGKSTGCVVSSGKQRGSSEGRSLSGNQRPNRFALRVDCFTIKRFAARISRTISVPKYRTTSLRSSVKLLESFQNYGIPCSSFEIT